LVDSLKALDPEWPIREADIGKAFQYPRLCRVESADAITAYGDSRRSPFIIETGGTAAHTTAIVVTPD
jgi:hypothetical protein